MRKYIFLVAISMMAISTLSSCLSDDTEYESYDDTAITGFTLGTLNRYFTKVKADGTDSIYKRTLNCASYTFSIDQKNGMIWNHDSLPVNVDPKAVLCTISTKNYGTAAIKSLTSDSLKAYNSKDSIDFSVPREVYVYNNSGVEFRRYTISVNVHKEVGDSCVWTKVADANADFSAMTDMKAFCKDSKMFLYGNSASGMKLYTTAASDGKKWDALTITPAISVEAMNNIVLSSNGLFYTVDGGKVLSSADGYTWSTGADASNLKKIIASSSKALYAIAADGTLVASADAETWETETLDEDAALLPTENVSYICRPLSTNANADKLIVIGSRDASVYADDKTSMVWTKINEYSEGSRQYPWNYVEMTSDNRYKAVKADWQITRYDANNIKGIYTTADGISAIYNSADDGLTWKKDTSMAMPEGMKVGNGAFAFVADDVNSVWVICGGTGQVWKARINRVAWKDEQKNYK